MIHHFSFISSRKKIRKIQISRHLKHHVRARVHHVLCPWRHHVNCSFITPCLYWNAILSTNISTRFTFKMVHCCVPGCTNYSAKTDGIIYHKIPKDSRLRKSWIARIRRENLPLLGNCYVCSSHFDSDYFEVDLVEKLTGQRRKRKLKPDAVPHIFNFSKTNAAAKRERIFTENRVKQRRHQEVSRLNRLNVLYIS